MQLPIRTYNLAKSQPVETVNEDSIANAIFRMIYQQGLKVLTVPIRHGLPSHAEAPLRPVGAHQGFPLLCM